VSLSFSSNALGPMLGPNVPYRGSQGQAESNNALGVTISPELYIFADEVNEFGNERADDRRKSLSRRGRRG
jgi:hypothetical protein